VVGGQLRDAARRRDETVDSQALELAVEHEAHAARLVGGLDRAALQQLLDVHTDPPRRVGQDSHGLRTLRRGPKHRDREGLLVEVDAHAVLYALASGAVFQWRWPAVGA